jgi:thioredoxin-related protein
MKPHDLIVAVAILLVPAGALAGGVARTGGTHDLQWTGWDAGLRNAAATHRPILVDVYTDWCGWCRRMDRDVYARDDVREYLSRRFVTVRLDAESTNPASYSAHHYTESSLAARFRVTGYPTTVFLKPDGEHLVNVPGYVSADRFLLLLQYIGDGHLERGVSFDDFVAKAGTRSPEK